MSDGAALRRDPWLSAVLDRACGTLDRGSIDRSLATRLDASGLDFVSAKVPPREIGELALLTDAGFRLVDTLVTFSGPAAIVAPAPRPANGALQTRPARPEDRAAVEQIAGSALALSRFHLDPSIGPALGMRVKRAWVANFFAGARGDAMTVVEGEGVVRGFLLALHDRAAARLVIDLVAVDPSWQGRSLGRLLVTAACASLADARTGAAGTQLANDASHRFYQSIGWSLTGATHVMHWHRRRSAA